MRRRVAAAEIGDLRAVSAAVAIAVVQAAADGGAARIIPGDIEAAVREAMWEPVYTPEE
jgi:malate dehydrogenase (oxaloacetate-decarboxylating)